MATFDDLYSQASLYGLDPRNPMFSTIRGNGDLDALQALYRSTGETDPTFGNQVSTVSGEAGSACL
jgi:hypothetical protein